MKLFKKPATMLYRFLIRKRHPTFPVVPGRQGDSGDGTHGKGGEFHALGGAQDVPEQSFCDDAAVFDRLSRLLCSLADLYDEMQLLSTRSSGDQFVQIVREKLRDKVELIDAAFICESMWNPSRQRAVQCASGQNSGTPVRVVRSVATGVILNERILRKQEVEITDGLS